MVIFTLLREGLCMVGMILIIQLVVVLLATCLVVVSSLVYDDLIQILGSEARKAIDQATHEYLDPIYLNQLHKENQNEQLR
jgi:hypothetical protein